MSDNWGTDGAHEIADAPPAEGIIAPSTIDAPSKKELAAKAKEAGWVNPTVCTYYAADDKNGEYHGAAPVSEWSHEWGDVAPANPELEAMLFRSEHQMTEGAHIDNLDFEANIEGPQKVTRIRTFAEAGLHEVILDNIKKCGYDKPTVVQSYAIPALLTGVDCIVNAQTGSGKTAAYMIPVISGLMGKAKKLGAPRPDTFAPGYNPSTHQVRAEPLVIIVVPTRELAIQIFDEARRMCYRSMLRPVVTYGGLPFKTTVEELGKGADVLIATPGRLCDIMSKPRLLSMGRVKYTIIDEADEMLESDWADELGKIMGGGDTNDDADHVFMMFSATFPKGARKLASQYMSQEHYRIKIGRPGSSHKNIRQNVIWVENDAKRQATYDLLFSMEPSRTIIFCNSKPGVDMLDDFLYNRSLPTTSIHGDRSQREREDALRAFRTGRVPILIATGVSARGWDIRDVNHVINYDLPSCMYAGITEYIHRIGRTARIGHQGLATSFYNERNEDIAPDLVKVLKECDCEIPDFLQQYVEEGEPNFDDDNSDDDEAEAEAEGAGDGADAGGFGAQEASAPAWGTTEPEVAEQGFQADGGAAAATGW